MAGSGEPPNRVGFGLRSGSGVGRKPDPEKSKHLNWSIRYNIACGIARGMHYLHEDSRIWIIHRDMKSSNIWLDSEMNPKIFGIDQTLTMIERIGGTYGYMSPKYAMNGQFSVKFIVSVSYF